MERVDKIISSQIGYSRKEVKELIKKKRVKLNEKLVTKAEQKINPKEDIIKVDEKELIIKKNIYLMLNKPKGYISATNDNEMPTVLELVPTEYIHRNLFPAGRLDKDTTGLMIITDDGDFAHNILSPQKHIPKKYNVTIDIPLKTEMIEKFKQGIKLIDGDCKPALLEINSKYNATVTLTEGRYHQIKRMFGCFNAKVIELKRISMGNFNLPSDLEIGECREFTEEELKEVLNK